jgi:hypothetical protein
MRKLWQSHFVSYYNNLQLQEIGNAIDYMSTHLNYKKSRDITVFKMFEDTKGVIRIHKSKTRQYNGQ